MKTTAYGNDPAFGIVDRLGRLYCADCAAELEKKADRLVFGLPHSAEPCDHCGKALNERTTAATR